MTVLVGFPAPEVTKMLASQMNRFGMSCDRPKELTTELSGSFPIRQPPIRWAVSGTTYSTLPPAASRIEPIVAIAWRINRRSFSP